MDIAIVKANLCQTQSIISYHMNLFATVGTESSFSLFVILQPFAKII